MNDITIEKIDEIISRMPNVSYEDAKNALVETNGDVLGALIYLENNKTSTTKTRISKTLEDIENSLPKDKDDLIDLKDQVFELIKKSNKIRIIIEKNSKTILNIPLTMGAVGMVFGSIFAIIGMGTAFVSKCTIKIENEEDGKVINLGKLTVEKINMLKDMVLNSKTKGTVKDEKDITDELFDEYDFTKED
ncbi:MAG: DUF4342 domain-containing protein [Peptostreptococcaceae bacterium]